MTNKNVCPNCGQLFDTDLDKCPLCGTAPQVVDTTDPVQRKRITEAERKQRRADRKEAEQEARRRRKDEQFMLDADEERQIEEEEARRKEEKRRRKEEKKAARRAAAAAEDAEDEAEDNPAAPLPAAPAFTAAPAVDGRRPMPEEPVVRDRRRVPRVFLALSVVLLIAALLVGGSYLLWKLDVVKIPYYEELAAKRDAKPAVPAVPDSAASTEAPVQTAPKPNRDENSIPCTAITLSETTLVFKAAGDQTQLEAVLAPSDTTDERYYTISDTGVAKVSPVGIVTAVAPGTAVITVTCGDISAECSVVCEFEDGAATAAPLDVDELILVKDDMTFFAAGENYVLSVTNVPVGTLVQWRSLDESVATVDASGHVVAVGPGTTRVFASVGDLEAYCWVRCKFE